MASTIRRRVSAEHPQEVGASRARVRRRSVSAESASHSEDDGVRGEAPMKRARAPFAAAARVPAADCAAARVPAAGCAAARVPATGCAAARVPATGCAAAAAAAAPPPPPMPAALGPDEDKKPKIMPSFIGKDDASFPIVVGEDDETIEFVKGIDFDVDTGQKKTIFYESPPASLEDSTVSSSDLASICTYGVGPCIAIMIMLKEETGTWLGMSHWDGLHPARSAQEVLDLMLADIAKEGPIDKESVKVFAVGGDSGSAEMVAQVLAMKPSLAGYALYPAAHYNVEDDDDGVWCGVDVAIGLNGIKFTR